MKLSEVVKPLVTWAKEKAADLFAPHITEAAATLGLNDLQKWLCDACKECPGGYAYVVDVFGDSTSGDVIVCCNSDYKRVPYEIGTANGKVTATLDWDQAVDVLPMTTWEEEADEDDHYASMESAAKPYTERPLYERFISKGERDAADSGSFAGKGKSFPLLKPGDVMAAVHAMGRAGPGNHSTATLKSNIIRIAKKKGWGKYLPKSWQGDDSDKEARGLVLEQGEVALTESAAFCQEVPLSEAAVRADYEIKLISPGWGSSGYYPSEVLERDGPQIYPAGTHMYWNHATAAEEAARPEGNLDHLAAVTTTGARWESQGKDGPGLYARAKVFSDYAEKVAEKAKYTGLSIRAAGRAKEGEREGRKGPIIERLTHGESVDFVTKAGRDGKVLTESARPSPTEEAPMTEAEARQFREVQAQNKKLLERFALQDGRDAIAEWCREHRIAPAVAMRISRRVLDNLPLKESGEIDRTKLTAAIEAEAKDELEYLERLHPTGRPINLGTPALVDPAAAAEQWNQTFEEGMKELATLFCGEGKENKAARKAFREGRAV